MNDINSLTFYRSFYEAIKILNDEQRLQIYDAIFDYQFSQKNITFDDVFLQSIWILIQPNIDASNSKKLAGAKGGRPSSDNKKASFSKSKKGAFQNQKASFSKSKSKEEEEEEEEVEVEKEVDVDVDVGKRSIATTTPKNKVFDFYMNNINSLPTLHEIEQLKEYQKEMSDDLICYAIEIATENKKQNLAYVKGILKSWQGKNITTLAEAKDEKKRFDSNILMDKEQQKVWERFMAKGDG